MLFTDAGRTGLGFADIHTIFQALIPTILKGPVQQPQQVLTIGGRPSLHMHANYWSMADSESAGPQIFPSLHADHVDHSLASLL